MSFIVGGFWGWGWFGWVYGCGVFGVEVGFFLWRWVVEGILQMVCLCLIRMAASIDGTIEWRTSLGSATGVVEDAKRLQSACFHVAK